MLPIMKDKFKKKSSLTTTLESYLDRNIKYIDWGRYSVKDLYDSYEQYRENSGITYDYMRGHFTKELIKLGHSVTKEVFVKGQRQISVVTNENLLH